MPRMRTLLLAACAAFSLALPGCLELTGQRLTLRYDAEHDRLLLLICHDGIHEDGDREGQDARRQLADHVEHGDVMFLDWFGRIEREKVSRCAGDEDEPAALRELARTFATSVRSHPIGHYRDPDGRIGAAQLIVVPGAREFVRKANAAVNEALLALADGAVPRGLRADLPRTFALLARGAAAGRQWIGLTQHAVTLSFPVDRAEFARVKAITIQDLLEELRKMQDKRDDDPGALLPGMMLQLLASPGLSYAELGDTVTLTLGGAGSPQTLRFLLRDDYRASLEEAVTASVPRDFDRLVADSLLGDTAAEPGTAAALAMTCVPPEDRVRAVVRAGQQAPSRAAADAWLRAFADQWNRDVGLPPAPRSGLDRAAWDVWYGEVLAFPIEAR